MRRSAKTICNSSRPVSIHALLAECDKSDITQIINHNCFNPRTPCGVRLTRLVTTIREAKFQSTHSLRSATAGFKRVADIRWFQSTHSLRSATFSTPSSLRAACGFNPRTPCGVRPSGRRYLPASPASFNPRTPCGVRRRTSSVWWTCRRFQSTHSLRSATKPIAPMLVELAVSIHALLAECDFCAIVGPLKTRVSIHALLAECDIIGEIELYSQKVSIHALLAECDPLKAIRGYDVQGFNPRTPCGVRRFGALSIFFNALFQSTHSLRSATFGKPDWVHRPRFQSTHSLRSATLSNLQIFRGGTVSIHALLAECDNKLPTILPRVALFQSTHSLRSATERTVNVASGLHGFNPRTPCGVRPSSHTSSEHASRFQSTHSLRSATVAPQAIAAEHGVSIHALLAECDFLR